MITDFIRGRFIIKCIVNRATSEKSGIIEEEIIYERKVSKFRAN